MFYHVSGCFVCRYIRHPGGRDNPEGETTDMSKFNSLEHCGPSQTLTLWETQTLLSLSYCYVRRFNGVIWLVYMAWTCQQFDIYTGNKNRTSNKLQDATYQLCFIFYFYHFESFGPLPSVSGKYLQLVVGHVIETGMHCG